ncbi:MAG: hypothetical protein LLG04_03125 [Parachlamydia sp.]|nr:hypothetical protein [Parachlamydia sp.]
MVLPVSSYEAFNQRLNAWIKRKCQETGRSYLIGHQLRLHFQRNVVLRDGSTLDLKRLDILPIDRSLALLPLVRKIRIAADLVGGIANVAQALHREVSPSPLPLLSEQEIKQANRLLKAVQELTSKVVTVYELDAFSVLRTFLFTSIGKCLQKDKILSTRVNYPGLENQTMKGVILYCRTLLLHTFVVLRSFEDPNQFSEAAKCIERVKELLSAFPQYREGKHSEIQQVYKEIDYIRTCLNLFGIALTKPLVYLPLMLVRVSNLPINHIKELDKEWVSPFADEWIADFVLGWETQSASFFSTAKTKHAADSDFQKKAALLREMSEALLLEARNGINLDISRILNSMHEFASSSNLSLEQRKQRLNSLETFIQDLSQRIQMFHKRYQQFKGCVEQLVSSSGGALHPVQASVETDQPIYFYYRLVSSIRDIFEGKQRFYQQFYQTVEQLIEPCPFQTLTHVSLLDLIQLQMRALFLQASTEKEGQDFHIKFEGLLDVIRNELALQRELDFTTKTNAGQLAYELEENLAKQANPSLLKPYKEILAILKRYFLMRDSRHLFAVNPFAQNQVSQKKQPELEQQYFLELYASCRRTLLTLQPKSLIQTYLTSNLTEADGHYFTGLQRLKEDFEDLAKIQDALRKQEKPTRTNYQNLASDLIARMTKFAQGIEDRSEELQLLIALDVAKAPALHKLSENLDNLNQALQSLFFSPVLPLISFLHAEELKQEKVEENRSQLRMQARQARKQKMPRPQPTPPTVVERKPVEKPTVEPANSLWQVFQERYKELIQSMANCQQTESQKACVQNLEGNLNLLQGLVATVKSQGERPHFILEANLAIMVHLEQTLALLNRSPILVKQEKSHEVYTDLGLESDWNQHAPHLQMRNAIDPKHLAFMKDRERVIAISSRYLGTEQDRLTLNVKRALSKGLNPVIAERYREGTQTELNAGMKACLALLENQKLAPTFFDEKPIPHQELDRLLAAKSSIQMDQSATNSCLSRLDGTLTRIQQYRMVAFHRQVASDELNGPQRKGTIRLALADIEMTANLSRDILQGNLDASQGLILSKQAWLRQAVALERVLLLVLSHLPAEESNNHFLWIEDPSRPRRYSHQLVSYTKKLRELLKGKVSNQLLEETQEQANDLEPYLKTLYRYQTSSTCPAKARLDKMEGLMRLRKQLQGNLQGWSEKQKEHLDKLLGATQSGDRLPLLDAHILNVVRNDALLPLLETLDLTEEWLQIYLKLLIEL